MKEIPNVNQASIDSAVSNQTAIVPANKNAMGETKDQIAESMIEITKPSIATIALALGRISSLGAEVQLTKPAQESIKTGMKGVDIGKTIKSPDNELCLTSHTSCTYTPRGVCVSIMPCTGHYCSSCNTGF